MTSDVEHFFKSIGHLYVVFGEVSIQVLCLFLNWIIWGGFSVEFCKFWILTPYRMYHW